MKQLTLLAIALFVLAGCKQDRAPDAAVAQASPSTPEVASPAAPCEEGQGAGYAWLPAGLALDIAYHLRADRIYTSKNDVQRRRVVLEFLDGDVDSVLAATEKSMIAAGFTARPRRDQPNGNIIVPYVKRGYGSITVVASATPGDNPSNPGAKGMVAFDFPAGEAAAVVAAPAAQQG